MSLFRNRIEELLLSRNRTQADLARYLDISPQAVNNWLRSGVEPRGKRREKVAEFFGISEVELMFGTSLSPENLIPVIAMDEVGTSTPESRLESHDWINPSCPVGEKTFGVKIEDDSMASLESPSFPAGSIAIVEPAILPSANDFVVIRRNNKGYLFQLVDSGGHPMLKPLNPRYPITPLEKEDRVIGVVREQITHIK